MSEELKPCPTKGYTYWIINYPKGYATISRHSLCEGTDSPLTHDEILIDHLCAEITALKKELASEKDAHELCHGHILTKRYTNGILASVIIKPLKKSVP